MSTARDGPRGAGMLAGALLAAGCAAHQRPSFRRAARDRAATAEAPLALFYAALSYERANRFATAAHLYAYVTREYDELVAPGSNPPRELLGEDRAQRINVLELSHFRAAVNYERSFDYEAAVRHFTLVASDPCFATAEHREEHVHDALLSVAQIFTLLGDRARVAAAWRAFLPHAFGEHEREIARLRAYEAPVRGAHPRAIERALRAYLRDVPATRHNAEQRAWARRRLAAAEPSDPLGSPFDVRSLDARPALAQQCPACTEGASRFVTQGRPRHGSRALAACPRLPAHGERREREGRSCGAARASHPAGGGCARVSRRPLRGEVDLDGSKAESERERRDKTPLRSADAAFYGVMAVLALARPRRARGPWQER